MDSYFPEEDNTPIEYGRVSAGLFFAGSIMGFNVMRGLQYEKMKHLEVNFILENDKKLQDLYMKNYKNNQKLNPLDSKYNSQSPQPYMFLNERNKSGVEDVNGIDRVANADYKIINDIVEEAHFQSRLDELKTKSITDIDWTDRDITYLENALNNNISVYENLLDDFEYLDEKEFIDKYKDLIDEKELKYLNRDEISKRIDKSINDLEDFQQRRSMGQQLSKARDVLKETSDDRSDKIAFDNIQKNIKNGMYSDDELDVLASKGMIDRKTFNETRDPRVKQTLLKHEKTINSSTSFFEKYKEISGQDVTRTPSGLSGMNESKIIKNIPSLVYDDGTNKYFSYNGLTFKTTNGVHKTNQEWAEFFNKRPFLNTDTMKLAGLEPASGPLLEVDIQHVNPGIPNNTTLSYDTYAKQAETFSFRTRNIISEMKKTDQRNNVVSNVLGINPKAHLYSQGNSIRDGVRYSDTSEIFAIFSGYNTVHQQRNVQQDLGAPLEVSGVKPDGRTFKGDGSILAPETVKELLDESPIDEFSKNKLTRHTRNGFMSLDTVVVYSGNSLADGQGTLVTNNQLSVIANGKPLADTSKIASPISKATISKGSLEEYTEQGLKRLGRHNVDAVFTEGLGKITQGSSIRGQMLFKVLKENEANDNIKETLTKIFESSGMSKEQASVDVDDIFKLYKEISEISNINSNGQFIINKTPNMSQLDMSKDLSKKLERLGMLSVKPVFEGVKNENDSLNRSVGIKDGNSALPSQFDKKTAKQIGSSELSRIYVVSDKGNIVGLRSENVQTAYLFGSDTMFKKNVSVEIDNATRGRTGFLGRWLAAQPTKVQDRVENAIFNPNVVQNPDGSITVLKNETKVVKIGSIESKFKTMAPNFLPERYSEVHSISEIRRPFPNKAAPYEQIKRMKLYADIMTGKNTNSSIPINVAKERFNEARKEFTENMVERGLDGTGVAFRNDNLNKRGLNLGTDTPMVSLRTLMDPISINETKTGYFISDDFYGQLELISNFIAEDENTSNTPSSEFLNSWEKQIINSKNLFKKAGVLSSRTNVPGGQTLAIESDKFVESYISNIIQNFRLTPAEQEDLRAQVIALYNSKNPGVNDLIVAGKRQDYFKGDTSFVQRSPAIGRATVAAVNVVELKNEELIDIINDVTGNYANNDYEYHKKVVRKYERMVSKSGQEIPYSRHYKNEVRSFIRELSHDDYLIKQSELMAKARKNINKALSYRKDGHRTYAELLEQKDVLLKEYTGKDIDKLQAQFKTLEESDSRFINRIKRKALEYGSDQDLPMNQKIPKSLLKMGRVVDIIEPVLLEGHYDPTNDLMYERKGRYVKYEMSKKQVQFHKKLNHSKPEGFGITVNSLNKLDFDGDIYKIFNIFTNEDVNSNLEEIINNVSIPDELFGSLDDIQMALSEGIKELKDDFNSLKKNKAELGEDLFSLSKTNIRKAKTFQDKIKKYYETLETVLNSPSSDLTGQQRKLIYQTKASLSTVLKYSGAEDFTPEEFLKNLNLANNVKKQWEDELKASKLFFRNEKGELVSIQQSIRDKGNIVEKKKGGIKTKTLKIGLKKTKNQITKEEAARYLDMTVEQLDELGIEEFEMVESIQKGGIEFERKIDKTVDDVFNRKAIVTDFYREEDYIEFWKEMNETKSNILDEYNKYENNLLENFNPNDDQINLLKNDLDKLDRNLPDYEEKAALKKEEIMTRKRELAIEDDHINDLLNKESKNASEKYDAKLKELKEQYKASGKIGQIEINSEQIIDRFNQYDTRVREYISNNNIEESGGLKFKKFLSDLDEEFNYKELEELARKNNISRVLSTSLMKDSLPSYFKFQTKFNTYLDVLGNLTGNISEKTKRNIGDYLSQVTQNALNVKKTESGGFMFNLSEGLNKQLETVMKTKQMDVAETTLRDMLGGNFMLSVDKVREQLTSNLKAAESMYGKSQEDNVKQYMKSITARAQDGFVTFKDMQNAAKDTFDATHNESNNIVIRFNKNAQEVSSSNNLQELISERVKAGSKVSDKGLKEITKQVAEDEIQAILEAKVVADTMQPTLHSDLLNVYNVLNAKDPVSLSKKDISKAIKDATTYGIAHTTEKYGTSAGALTNKNSFMANLLAGLDSDDLGGHTYTNGNKSIIRGTALPLIGLGALAAFAVLGPTPKSTISGKIRRNSDFVRSMEKNEDNDPVDIKYEIFKQTSQNPIII